MSQHAPAIDVIVAAWRAAPTIERAILSALAQAEVARVIVVDDCSPDETARVAAACDSGDGRLLVLRQPVNAGPSAARNRAIAVSTSPWIAILDADDWLEPGRFAGLLAYARDVDIVADDVLTLIEGEATAPRAMLGNITVPQLVDLATFVRSNIAHRRSDRAELGFVKPILRRDFLAAHDVQYREDMRLGEDYELYARALALGGRMLLVPPQGYVYVQSPFSLAGTHGIDDLRRLRDCDDALPAPNAAAKVALRAHRDSIDCKLQWRLLIEAVKARDLRAGLTTFTRSSTVSLFLAEQLARQAWERCMAFTR